MKNRFFVGLLSVLVIALTAFASVTTYNLVVKSSGAISVSGKGEVFVVPDLATVNLVINSEARSIEEALKDNSERTEEVVSYLSEQGIGERDTKSYAFNIFPRYEYNQTTGKRSLIGYQVVHAIEVKTRDLAKIGSVIEGAVEAGVNEVSGIQFVLEEEEEYREEAKALAIADAKRKAEETAEALGVKIVKIASYSEDGVSFYNSPVKELSYDQRLEGSGVSLQSGENLISATVRVVYEVR